MRSFVQNLPDDPTREELEALIYQRAATDGMFWNKLVGDPHAALLELFGKSVPSDLQVTVKVEDATTMYHVVPHPDYVEYGSGPSVIHPRTNLHSRLNYLIHSDAKFREWFARSPKEAVAWAFEFRMPHHIDFQPLQETPTSIYLVLQWEPHNSILTSPYAIEFNGVKSGVYVPYSKSLEFTDALTVEVWMKAFSFQPGNWQSAIVSHHGEACGWELRVGGAIPRFMVTINGTHYYAQPPDERPFLTTDAWHYIAGVFGDGKLSLYLNGVYKYGLDLSGLINSGTGPMLLGRNSNDQWTDRAFHGLLDEVRILSRAKSASEIARNRPRKVRLPTPPPSDPGLRYYFPMLEGSGNIVIDHSMYGFDGMIVNDAKWVATGVNSAPRA